MATGNLHRIAFDARPCTWELLEAIAKHGANIYGMDLAYTYPDFIEALIDDWLKCELQHNDIKYYGRPETYEERVKMWIEFKEK